MNYQRQSLAKQTVTARLLLETLRDRVNDASWEIKRELAEALAERVLVNTVYVQGKRKPVVTVRYRFADKHSYCSSPRLWGDNITVRQHDNNLKIDSKQPVLI